jgi:formate dehydrogenase subunit beta
MITMIQINQIYYLKSSDGEISELGECGGSLTTLMKFLLENKIVDGVLAVEKGNDIYDAVPALICDADEIGRTAGSLHCGTLNIAKILVKYFDEFPDLKLAITAKPCEAKTIIELGKRGKIDLNNLIMVGVNCGGTFPPVTTRNMIETVFHVNADDVTNEEIDGGKFIIKRIDGSKKEINIDQLEEGTYGRRYNCRRCEMNIPTSADVSFGNWGVSGSYAGEYSCVEVFSERGAEILAKAIESGYLLVKKPSKESVENRGRINTSMVNLAKKWQIHDFEENENDILSTFTLYQEEFKKCIKCFGCRDACPVCYCQDCTLESGTPEWVDKGRIPPSPLFHLERLIHMVESCTNCGQCEDVCPMDIPLAKIWHQINLKVTELKYSPAMDSQELILFDFFKRPE